MIEWYGTPPYCAILRIKISNKISHKLITFFFPKELKRIHYESQSNEFKSQRLQFLLFQKLLNIVKLKLWKCFDNIVLLSTLMLRCPLLAALSLLYTVTWFQTVRLSIITKIILSKLLILLVWWLILDIQIFHHEVFSSANPLCFIKLEGHQIKNTGFLS